MPRSLSLRFFLASVVLLPMLLGLSAYSLDVAMRRSLLSGEQESLKTQVYLLLGVAELTDGELWMPEQFQEPRYNQIDSGLYALAQNARQQEVWRSPSAQLLNLTQASVNADTITPGTTSFSQTDSDHGTLFSLSHDIVWEQGGEENYFRLLILHQQDQYLAELSSYRKQLWRWLGILAVFIIVTQTLILRWGLKPLSNLARDLQNIKSGKSEQLTGHYPTEIQPVTDNLNQVLSSEREQRDRYRTTLDDLAHSLKTPLSVIQSSAQSGSASSTGDAANIITEQVERMNQIVDHQLKRAVVGNIGMMRSAINVKTLVTRMI